VLLKNIEERGFVFYTNYMSRKGIELDSNPYAAMLFFWAKLERQVRIEGRAEKITSAESDTYFHSRPRNAQLAAAVSRQSEVVPSRDELETVYKKQAEATGDSPIARPAHWGGYRIVPERYEFWQGRENRLHDRFRYVLTGSTWKLERLWP
jgi:pyridoxamine 5'-phosphate oxidase